MRAIGNDVTRTAVPARWMRWHEGRSSSTIERRLQVAELKARDAKLIQYMREAHVKERELEQALQAHISMTALTPYRKRLQQHLTETKNHARSLERRIKQLGGGE